MMKNFRTTYNRILLEPLDLKTANLDAPRDPSRVSSPNCILILDDDPHFRALVSKLLATRGYDVVEARTAEEALENLQQFTPAAAIVDYRLPCMDGMTWIAKIRELGIDMPVVFVSGTWCDERTFNWLRNILKVSLVVKKPIIPEAFLTSLETIVPPPPGTGSASNGRNVEDEDSFNIDEFLNHHSLEEALNLMDSLLETSNISSKTREQLMRSRKVLATRLAVEKVRRKYALELPSIWDSFINSLKALKDQPQNELLATLRLSVHKIKGSTGSYGFIDVSQLAERVETLLAALDQSCSIDQQNVIWNEILQECDEGSRAIAALQQIDGVDETGENQKKEISLLIVSPEGSGVVDEFSQCSGSFKTKIAHVVSAIGAVNRCKRECFDAAVIDISIDSEAQAYSQLAMKIRNLPNCSALPFAFVLREGQKMDDAHLIYSGGSAVIERPMSHEGLDDVLDQLLVDSMFNKLRVLCVDDDPAQTAFLASILHKEGFSVRCLNDPIRVLEVMEEFQPHVVLLDVIMPGLSGYEVCRMIRSRKDFAKTIVMILTARNDADSRNAAFLAGGDEFLGKPVVSAELITRVNTNLAAKRQKTLFAPLVLTEASFRSRTSGLTRQCAQSGLPISLIAMSFANFADLDVMFGTYSCEQVAQVFTKLLGSRFRSCDLRGTFAPDQFVVALPAIPEYLAAEVADCFRSEWDEIWFPGSRGQRFQAVMLTEVAEVKGPESIDQLLFALAEKVIHESVYSAA